MSLRIFLLAFLLPLVAFAQLPNTYKGTFYIRIDDGVTLFLNGKEFFQAGVGNHQTNTMSISEGDRLVARLMNEGGPSHFFLTFVSEDGKTVLSFRAADFKCAPNNELVDFTSEEFASWQQRAVARRIDKPPFPKNNSQNFWGALNNCTVATIISRDMVKNN